MPLTPQPTRQRTDTLQPSLTDAAVNCQGIQPEATQSTFVYQCQGSDFLILSGKNTGELEVGTLRVGGEDVAVKEPS